MKKMSVLLLAAIVSLFFAACGGSPSTPEAVAESYLKASLKSDYGTMKKLSSEKNKEEVEKEQKEWKEKEKEMPAEKKEMLKAMQAMTPKADEARISEDGNTASVKVNLLNSKGEQDGFSFRYKLVKENDNWKVDDQSK
jgi:ABC-type transporter MlaC component